MYEVIIKRPNGDYVSGFFNAKSEAHKFIQLAYNNDDILYIDTNSKLPKNSVYDCFEAANDFLSAPQ